MRPFRAVKTVVQLKQFQVFEKSHKHLEKKNVPSSQSNLDKKNIDPNSSLDESAESCKVHRALDLALKRTCQDNPILPRD